MRVRMWCVTVSSVSTERREGKRAAHARVCLRAAAPAPGLICKKTRLAVVGKVARSPMNWRTEVQELAQRKGIPELPQHAECLYHSHSRGTPTR